MIIFENDGEIDAVSICTFGVNVKAHDSAIGYFGTGLKYAIAVLLRLQQEIVIQAGEKTHVFSTKTETVRGKQFDVVQMDGSPLGFTTELGKNWGMWQAFRELYCNMTDELGTMRRAKRVPKPAAGVTRVIVTGEAFESLVLNEMDNIILPEGRALARSADCSIRDHNKTNHIYYQGVLAYVSNHAMRFTYNLTRRLTLTEDRTIKNMYEAHAGIAKTILQSENKHVIKTCITEQDGFEHQLDFNWPDTPPGPAFLEVVAECRAARIPIASTAAQAVRSHVGVEKYSKTLDLSKVQAEQLKRAVAFCKKIRFPVDEYPVVVLDCIEDNVLGLAKDNTIFLSSLVFAQGTKQVAATLIEEFIHLKHGLEDETRALQTYLFDCIVSLGEEMQGAPV